MNGTKLRDALLVIGASAAMLGLTQALSRRLPRRASYFMMAFTGVSALQGLLYVNGGMDGTHLYPLLWGFALVGCIGLYGSWPLTIMMMVLGSGVEVLDKLVMPDASFGAGADQSWQRIAAQCTWWCIALTGTGISGRRVIAVTKAARQSRQAMLTAQTEAHASMAQAEQLRLAAATERAEALTDLARAFDGEVRSLVGTVAQTSAGIGAHASAVSDAATDTGERVRRAASLASAVAEDTSVVAQNATQLDASLTYVRTQAQSAAAAAVAATSHVAESDAALVAHIAAVSRVGKAISLIGAIADQTNLLALNATIESARAGEAGRGFAVVAAEVKMLARRAAAAADEVDQMVHAMRLAGERAATALDQIGVSIVQVAGFAEQVSAAAEHQAVAVGAITRTIASLNDKADEVRQQVTDVAISAAATSEASGAMLAAAAALGQDAGSLQAKAGSFIASVRAA